MKLAAIAILSIASLAAGCVDSQQTKANAEQQRPNQSSNNPISSADQALERWMAQRPAQYSLVMQRTCFCLPEFVAPMRVIFANGEILSATYLDSGDTVSLQVFKSLKNIEGWLTRISELEAKENAELKTAFNNEYGYPTYFYVDRHPRIADDTEELKISEFSVLP